MVNPADPKSCKRQNVREAILDAMGTLIERMGYHKTTVEDVAAEAGIGKGSVYLHFASKEDIALEWIDRMHESIMGKLRAVARRSGDPEARAKKFLQARVLQRFDQFCKRPLSVEQMMTTLRRELHERKERFHAEEAELLSRLLAEIDGVEPERSLADARAMILATNALLPYSLKPEQMGNRASFMDNASRIAELLVTGYIHRTTRTEWHNETHPN